MHTQPAPSTAPAAAPRKRRPHPARRARRIVGAGGVASMVVLTGCMTIADQADSSASAATTASTSSASSSNSTASSSSNQTSTAAAATPSASASSNSSGS